MLTQPRKLCNDCLALVISACEWNRSKEENMTTFDRPASSLSRLTPSNKRAFHLLAGLFFSDNTNNNP
jgi:hypothetical protein